MKNPATTEQKYFNFLSTLASRQRGFTSINKVVHKNRLSSHAVTVLKNRSLVSKNNGTWKWTGPSPDRNMASAVVGEVNSIITGYVNRQKAAKQQKRTTAKHTMPTTNGMQAPRAPKACCNDTLSISSLKNEKEKLMARIAKIDTVISVVDEFQNA